VYRIEVRPGGPDPLVALRSDDDLDEGAVAAIRQRLDRLDAMSPTGPWTHRYLAIIGDHPHVRAQDLAEGLGLDKPTFKGKVRKLKALGLTISHSPGYELSPRALAYLASGRGDRRD
jgi:DNA-binding MarR family transcriptional regulator